eukprot:2118611-Ditylum_brightwellii.AAC.1
MDTLPIAIPKSIYATINASFPNTCLPRELCGLLSSPIMTESDPVPNGSPTAIRRQNSIEAQMKGMMPIMKMMMVVSGDSCCASNVVVAAGIVVVVSGAAAVDVDSIADERRRED